MISAIISGILQWFLGLFGASDAERLGKTETENQYLRTDLKEKADEVKIMSEPDKPYDTLLGLFDKRAK